MGIPELIQGIDKEIKKAKEIIGEYGEYRGVHCPHCGIRIYPKHKAGELETCVTCGEDFIVPTK